MGFQPVRNEWTESQTKALMAYRQSGLPVQTIADEMGLTKGQVLGRIWKVEHPTQPKFRGKLWTDEQKDIVRLGAFTGAHIDEICELLAKAGRSMQPAAVRHSTYYRLGIAQAKAVEERLAEERRRQKAKPAGVRPNVYQWRHPEGAIINLPVVKGYVGEQAHV